MNEKRNQYPENAGKELLHDLKVEELKQKYDLEERLLDYAASIIVTVERLPATRAGNHIAGQLLRSGTSPLSNHGEAQGAESRKDFIHKMSLCLKELRESRRWIRLVAKAGMHGQKKEVQEMLQETEELIGIFAASIKTARMNAQQPPRG